MGMLPLFDGMPQPAKSAGPSAMEVRERRMREAFDAAGERFKEEFQRVLMRFVDKGVDFTGEDVRHYYAERASLPQPREWRAVGSFYARLRRQGVIEIVGYRKRENGNPTAVYRKAK